MQKRFCSRHLSDRSFLIGLCLASIVSILSVPAKATVDNWTGSGGSSWATSSSWSPSGGPGIGDTASFTDTNSVAFAGTVTSTLNATRTIGGLAFNDTAGHYHTLDLNAFTLTVNGSLNFNTDQNSSTITTIRDGTLSVTGASSNVFVDNGISGSSTGSVDFSGLSAFTVSGNQLLIGVSSSSGGANGTLSLSPSNTLNTQLIQVGAANNSNDVNGTLHLGLNNTITTPEFDIGKDNATANVTITNGGALNLCLFISNVATNWQSWGGDQHHLQRHAQYDRRRDERLCQLPDYR